MSDLNEHMKRRYEKQKEAKIEENTIRTAASEILTHLSSIINLGDGNGRIPGFGGSVEVLLQCGQSLIDDIEKESVWVDSYSIGGVLFEIGLDVKSEKSEEKVKIIRRVFVPYSQIIKITERCS